MFRVLCLLCLQPIALASRLRRADHDFANANDPKHLVDLPVLCKSHDDCGWAEYCGWSPKPTTELERKNLATRCQTCVGCVEPEDKQWYGVALASVTRKCPDCEERAVEGKKRRLPAYKKIITPKVDADVEELRKQKQILETKVENVELRKEKQALERELEKVKGSVYDSNANHQASEQELRDEKRALKEELNALRKNLQAREAATDDMRMNTRRITTTSTTTAVMGKPGKPPPGAYHNYNTYNIYNTYNTHNTYNSNGHTFNSWSSCENSSQPMPMGVAQAPKPATSSLLRLRRLSGVPPSPSSLNLNCTGVLVD